MGKSPQAQRMLKFAFNLLDDGLMGQQVFAGEATRLAYMTDEAVEGRDQFLEKRDPDWSPFPGTSKTGHIVAGAESAAEGPPWRGKVPMARKLDPDPAISAAQSSFRGGVDDEGRKRDEARPNPGPGRR